MEKIIVVDKKDRKIGVIGKEKAHTLEGVWHRAFSVFVVNKKGEVLLQKRSKKKRLWPLFWSNTCCSHPRVGEEVLVAAERRLKEELGFSCPLKFLFKFGYRAVYKKVGSENEICYVFWGRYDGKVKPNKQEVAATRWIDFESLRKKMIKSERKLTPWMRQEAKKISKSREIMAIFGPKKIKEDN